MMNINKSDYLPVFALTAPLKTKTKKNLKRCCCLTVVFGLTFTSLLGQRQQAACTGGVLRVVTPWDSGDKRWGLASR